MNNNTNLSVGDLASALGGAGLTLITTDLVTALILVGVAVALKILVAIMTKNGYEVSSHVPLG